MFACLASAFHLGTPVFPTWSHSAGVPPTTTAPCARNASCIFLSLAASAIAACILLTTAGGVLVGANIAYHESTLKPLMVSDTDGTSGRTGVRSLVETASAFKRPLLMCCVTEGKETHSKGMVPPNTSIVAGPPPR